MSTRTGLRISRRGHRTGKLAAVRADGRPHVAPIWFVIDGEDLLFNTGAGHPQGQGADRDPRAALTVDIEEPPYAFVTVEGTVTLESDIEAMLPHSIAMAADTWAMTRRGIRPPQCGRGRAARAPAADQHRRLRRHGRATSASRGGASAGQTRTSRRSGHGRSRPAHPVPRCPRPLRCPDERCTTQLSNSA